MYLSSHRKGFTLIELLVVIAIIAILAAILFPVFAQAKASAKKAADLSNFKQTGLSLIMYSGDFDDMAVPLMYGPPGDNGWNYSWQTDTIYGQVVFPYIKNWQITHNPADPNATDAQALIDMGYPQNATGKQRDYAVAITSSEGYNYMAFSPMFADASGLPQFTPINNSQLTQPAECIMLSDSAWDRNATGFIGGGNWFVEAPHYAFSGTAYWFNGWQYQDPTNAMQYGFSYPIHSGFKITNTTFGDGHAKGLTVGAELAGVSITSGGTITGVYDQSLYPWDRGN
jgi:prepilin-type N-terminal cleavage/methylation domain-containing protein